MSYENLPLINNDAIHNFELFVDDERAFIDYRLKNDKMYLVHTEIPTALEGKGVASAIVTKALEYIEQHHLKLVPLCVYVQAYLKRHPEWNRLLADQPAT
jgi:predicted GNAT family acetyltransferase